MRSLGIPFSANWRAQVPWRHRWKARHCSTGHNPRVNVLNIASRSPSRFPRINCHIPLYRLKIHTWHYFLDIYNHGIIYPGIKYTIYTFKLRNGVPLKVLVDVRVWRGSALFKSPTIVLSSPMHCDVSPIIAAYFCVQYGVNSISLGSWCFVTLEWRSLYYWLRCGALW